MLNSINEHNINHTNIKSFCLYIKYQNVLTWGAYIVRLV